MRALAALLLASVAAAQGTDGAHLAVDYTVYRSQAGEVLRSNVGRPTLVVTTAHWIPLAAVKDGSALALHDLDTGAGPIALELADIGGLSVITGTPSAAFNWFLFTAAAGEELRTDGRYELVIHYERVDTWLEATEDEEGNEVPTPSSVTAPVRVTVAPLPAGQKVDNYGNLAPADDALPRLDAPPEAEGFQALIDDLTLELTPQVAEDSDELSLTYRVAYEVDRIRLGGSRPGQFTLDLALNGRTSSDRSDLSLSGWSQGELSARAMFLLGESRYYPVGARLAVGYEGGDDNSDAEGTATAQVFATVPYVGDVLLAWQDALGFERAFAPPFVGVAYTGSGAEVGADEQDRWEVEAGWIAPIAPQWDLDLRWRRFDFTESGVDEEELFEMNLTYYPGGDLSQGLRMTFEDGYRAAVGDVGSTLLLGYTLSL